MNQGSVFKIFDITGFIPTGWMFNSVEPRNTDQSHKQNYIYYSTEIKSKLVKILRNRVTELQYCKNIYISGLLAVIKLLPGKKLRGNKGTEFVEKYSFFDNKLHNGHKKHV